MGKNPTHTNLLTRLKKAQDLDSKESLQEFALPFIHDVCAVFLPDHFLEVREMYNPQEEAKDLLTLQDKLQNSVNQFAEVVTQIE